MTPQQALIVLIGVVVIVLSIHEYWGNEYRALIAGGSDIKGMGSAVGGATSAVSQIVNPKG